MRVLVSIALVVLCMSSVTTARKRRFAADVQADDPLARVEVLGRVENVEYIRPATVMGECSCVCCDNEPAQRKFIFFFRIASFCLIVILGIR